MTRTVCLAALLLTFCPRPATAQIGKPVRHADDFREDTLKQYDVRGDARWEKGAISLGAGAEVIRKLPLGFTAEAEAVVRWPDSAGRKVFGVLLGDGKGQVGAILAT